MEITEYDVNYTDFSDVVFINSVFGYFFIIIESDIYLKYNFKTELTCFTEKNITNNGRKSI